MLAALSGIAGANDSPMLVRVDLSMETDINRLSALPLDIPYIGDDYAEVVAYARDLSLLDSAELKYRIVYEDMTAYYQSRNPMNLDMGGFPTFSEAINIIDSLHNYYPNIVSAKWSIGLTWEARNLWVFKLSDNVDVDEAEPEIFYNALTHAREPIGMTWILNFAGWLCRNYGLDPIATSIVNNRELYFLPVLNPDGYVYNEQNSPNGGGMWRGNRRNNGDGTYGVDLNRNWGYMWGYDNSGSSPIPGSETYRGPSPFSEPETQAVRQFILSRSFSFIVNSHSYAGVVLYPWGYEDIYTPDQDFFRVIGDSATTLIGYPNGTAWELLYNTNGDANDWQYGEQIEKDMIFCLAPETGEDFDGFWPQPSRIDPLNQQMLPFGIYAAQLAGQLAGLSFSYPSGTPETVTPGVPTTFEVVVDGVRGGIPVSGSGQLHYSINGAPIVDENMLEISSGHYQATLPAIECGSLIEFYFTAEEVSSGIFTDPRDAPAVMYSAIPATNIVVAFDDNFEADLGWTVIDSGGLTDGTWERGIPAGLGDRGDPPADYDGSGQCYLTDNVYGNSDVDYGFTFLISPAFDLSGVNATVHYAIWYTNNFGSDPNNDLFKVFVSSDNGVNWVLAETIGPTTQNGWTEHSFEINSFITPTDQVKVRFEASDVGLGSVVEAGVDAFSIDILECGQTDIPTLSEWGMMILGLLLVSLLSIAAIRQRKAAPFYKS